jgi:PAS domain S-box-containing protein
MRSKRPSWLVTTVTAVRELMLKRMAGSLDQDAKRDAEMALQTLDLLWEQLEGEGEMLTREHERYLALFENAPDAYLVTDAGGSVREANCAAAELLQLPADEIRGRSLVHLIAEDDKAAFLARLIALLASPDPAGWCAHIQGGRRDLLLVHFGVRPIPLAKSGVGGLCWVVRPVP